MKQPEGLRSSCARLALIAVLTVGACSPEASVTASSFAQFRVGSTIVLDSSQLLVRFHSDIAPLSVRARPGGFAVLDRSQSQLVLLDTTLEITRRVGRVGGGPGELRGVIRLETWHGGLAIGETGNGRISLFTASGQFRGVAQRRYVGGPFAITDRGALITQVQVPPALLDVGSLDDPTPQRVGVRPAVSDPADARHTGRDLIAFRSDGLSIVVENRSGEVLQVKNDGSVTARWTFPVEMQQRLQQYRRARVAAFESRMGGRVFAAPMFKDVSVQGSQILVSHSVGPDCLLLLDLEVAVMRPIRTTAPDLNDALCRSESIALSRDFLVVAVDDSLLRFPSPFTLASR